jgi:hypothetical protein
MDDSKPIPREHDRAIRAAIETLVAAQFRAIEASRRLAEERLRIDDPTSAWGRFDRSCRVFRIWVERISMAMTVTCVLLIPAYVFLCILRIALRAWNAA